MEQTKNAIPTVAGWLNTWLEVYVKGKNEHQTYLCYNFSIKMILRHNPDYEQLLLNQITELEMQEMINRLCAANYAKSTLEKARTVMKQAYEAAMHNHLCQQNPAASLKIPPSAHKRKIVALTKEEQELLETAALSDCLGHLVIFFLKTGLRAHELCNLTWEHYSPKNKTIYVADSKTERGVRYIPLLPEAQAIIERQDKSKRFIFASTTGDPVTPTVLKKLYARMRAATGLDFITTHVYRHSFATRLVEQGVDYKALSQLLGHADVAFTLQCYTQPDFVFLHEQIQRLSNSELFSPEYHSMNQLIEANQTLSARIQMLEAVVAETMNQILDLNQKLCARLDQMELHHT